MRRGRSDQRQRAVRAGLLLVMGAATHLLVTQLCKGAERAPGLPEQRFVAPVGGMRVTTLEFRAETTVSGAEVRVKDLMRWGEDGGLHDTGDLVVARLEGVGAGKSIDINEVKQTLQDAGVNLGSLNFTGSMVCKVSRVGGVSEAKLSARVPLTLSDLPTEESRPRDVALPVRTLRQALTEELANQLGISPESLQMRFEARDERILSLMEPEYTFQIEPRRQKRLGDVSWDLHLVRAGDRQKVTVRAHARAWQIQVVAVKPMVMKQEIRGEDLTERRILTDRLADEEKALTIDQALGQSASRDISIGTVLNGKMLEPPNCARVNQFVNVTVEQGGVKVMWVAEARESGARGQTIRVRKPGTRDEFTVLLTGPEQGRLIGPAQATGTKLAAKN